MPAHNIMDNRAGRLVDHLNPVLAGSERARVTGGRGA